MSTLIWNSIRRSRPRIGWPQASLAFAAVLCPALAATGSRLALPVGLFFWAGVIGLWFGLLAGGSASVRRRLDTAGRPGTHPAAPPPLNPPGFASYTPRIVGWLALTLAFAALLIAAGQALPPFGLMTQDIAAWLVWALAVLQRHAGMSDMPPGRVWEFFAASLPRFWHNLMIAPYDGERGARLLLAAGGPVAT